MPHQHSMRVLTPRRIDVLNQLALGKTNKEIAKALHISVETVKEHMHQLITLTGCGDRTALAMWWVWLQGLNCGGLAKNMLTFDLERGTATFKGETHEVPPPVTQRDGGLRAGSVGNEVNGGGVPVPGHLLPDLVTLPIKGA